MNAAADLVSLFPDLKRWRLTVDDELGPLPSNMANEIVRHFAQEKKEAPTLDEIAGAVANKLQQRRGLSGRFREKCLNEDEDARPFGMTLGWALESLYLVTSFRKACESEIEKDFAFGLTTALMHCPYWARDQVHFGEPDDGKDGVFVTNQTSINRYRADFVVVARHTTDKVQIAVECDGREWHTTPEQSVADQARDQEIFKAGYRVLRFTGREIRKFPERCGWDVLEAIHQDLGTWG